MGPELFPRLVRLTISMGINDGLLIKSEIFKSHHFFTNVAFESLVQHIGFDDREHVGHEHAAILEAQEIVELKPLAYQLYLSQYLKRQLGSLSIFYTKAD